MRINEQIRVRQVRLVDEEGKMVGVVPIEDARARADAAGLDLIEVAPEAKPPVCKIQDYGKLKYRESKKLAKSRKATHQIVLKEIRMRPKTEEHDFQVKMRNAIRFLEEGDKVQFTVMFRGREMAHQEVGRHHMQRIVEQLTMQDEDGPEPPAVLEQSPRMTGNRYIMVVSARKPGSAKAPKRPAPAQPGKPANAPRQPGASATPTAPAAPVNPSPANPAK